MIDQGRRFTPVSPSGQNPIHSNEKLLIHSYTPDSTSSHVVAKTPGLPDQYIIGPDTTCLSIATAFNLLDSLFPSGHHRQINVVITLDVNPDSLDYVDCYNHATLQDLRDRFGLTSTISDTRYDKTPVLGIIADTRKPLFYAPNYDRLGPKYGQDCISLFWATTLWHEWTHVLQARNSLPTNSTWAERHAVSEHCRLMLVFLNSGRLARNTESMIAKMLRAYSQRIQDYRNGTGFHDHLDIAGSNADGSPTKDQRFHIDDFSFGR